MPTAAARLAGQSIRTVGGCAAALLANQGVSIVWAKDGEGFHATALGPAGEIRFRVTVENDGSRWNWSVTGTLHRGRAVTLHGAMWEAERVALRKEG